jgi:single-stranded DNA-binding protein
MTLSIRAALSPNIEGRTAMDLNLIVLCGRLAVEGELRVFDSGARLIRYLVTVRVDYPRSRVDVVPVTLWDPPDELVDHPGQKGERIWVCGSVQRRYWESPDGRRSRIEVVAEQINFKDVDELEPVLAE